jgi:hypothetical protein
VRARQGGLRAMRTVTKLPRVSLARGRSRWRHVTGQAVLSFACPAFASRGHGEAAGVSRTVWERVGLHTVEMAQKRRVGGWWDPRLPRLPSPENHRKPQKTSPRRPRSAGKPRKTSPGNRCCASWTGQKTSENQPHDSSLGSARNRTSGFPWFSGRVKSQRKSRKTIRLWFS